MKNKIFDAAYIAAWALVIFAGAIGLGVGCAIATATFTYIMTFV